MCVCVFWSLSLLVIVSASRLAGLTRDFVLHGKVSATAERKGLHCAHGPARGRIETSSDFEGSCKAGQARDGVGAILRRGHQVAGVPHVI
jgi:hypothetical protein